MQIDHSILEAALVGYQFQLKAVQEKIAVLRAQMGHKAAHATVSPASTDGAPKKRTMSASARKRIAAAQKKRWAEFHAAKQVEK
jgi:hypothetical protein